ncbi:stage V sporulation protein R, partial [Paenibacillus sp. FSL P4-0338]
ALWGRTVHLQTVVEDKNALFTYDGKKVQRRFM